MGELHDRRQQTRRRIGELRERLREAEGIVTGKACVYATGSFGRVEASSHSDLDLFIVGKSNGQKGRDGKEGSLLRHLDEIRVKADLIETTQALRIPEFSGDGRYLTHYSVDELVSTLGTPEDDANNTLTARLLLLLESFPLLESAVYDEVIEDVIAAYWRDYEDHKSEFVPAFLTNDILRLWRTLCVNYEAKTERQPKAEKAKGKLKNYKLKQSRLLTCYSALLYLLAIYRREKSVRPTDAVAMVHLTPTERLEWLLNQDVVSDAHNSVRSLLEKYEEFLQMTNASEEELVASFMNKSKSRDYITKANDFGNVMFDAIKTIGGDNRFHRLLVV